MDMIKIDKPVLNNKMSEEERLSQIEHWLSDTTDKLNIFIMRVVREVNNNGNSKDL